MNIFKILMGDSSHLDFETTPFCAGHVYLAKDTGGLYVDVVLDNQNKRICVNDFVSDEIKSYVEGAIEEAIGDAISDSY